MGAEARFPRGVIRVSAGRSRRILIASGITLLTSVCLLGLVAVIRWRGQQAVQSDARTVLADGSQRLLRALQSRRGTLTFLRDTLTRGSNLSLPQLQAMGSSSVEHTRHLLGTGEVLAAQPPLWWSEPKALAPAELAQLNHAIVQHTQLRGAWRVPSTFVTTTKLQRMLLIMLEPLRTAAAGQGALIGVFDLKSLLEDFVSTSLPQRYPAQILDGDTLLYRSDGWLPTTSERRPIVVEHSVVMDATHWTIQMQPGSTRVVETLSWFNLLLIGLSVLTGLGITVIVWILAARTWILQRAVARRTAALRRVTKRLRQMAITDELTGLYNRRFFLDRWEWECRRAKRYRRPLACLMVDVNNFKQVNDRLGHHVGDLVLRQVAQELKAALRQSDILARFGGDEFIIALPETSTAAASSVAEKLRRVSIRLPEGATRGLPPISLSIGMSRTEQADENPQDILEAADQSLYASKRHTKSAPAHQIS